MLVLRLALRDWLDEWPTSLCLTVGVIAAAVPLMLLLAIRTGVVGQLRAELEAYASSRALVSIGQPVVRWGTIDALRARSDVAFAVPQTRLLSASAVLRAPNGTNVVVDLLPSGKGDPLIPAWRDGAIALSPDAARQARVRPGDKVQLVVSRINNDGVTQEAIIERAVGGIAELRDSGRRFALIDLEALVATEEFRENAVLKSFTEAQLAARATLKTRAYSGVRVFANDLDAVEDVRAFLLSRGIETDGRVDEIRLVRRLDRGLSIFIAVIAGLGALGLGLSLAAAQWAWVERRRQDLSYLRLIGMAPHSVALLPVWQMLLVVGSGLVLATLFAWIGSIFVNGLFAGQLATVRDVSSLGIMEVAPVVMLALVAALLATLVAVRAVRRIGPAEALRGA